MVVLVRGRFLRVVRKWSQMRALTETENYGLDVLGFIWHVYIYDQRMLTNRPVIHAT